MAAWANFPTHASGKSLLLPENPKFIKGLSSAWRHDGMTSNPCHRTANSAASRRSSRAQLFGLRELLALILEEFSKLERDRKRDRTTDVDALPVV
jgi:hypothetical protein